MNRTYDEPHIVHEMKIENTRIKFADNYCVKTNNDVKTILKNIARITQNALSVNC